jgi:enoyl-CoA hydratase
MKSEVAIEREGATGIIRLSRPEASNALTLESKRLIGEGLAQFEADAAVRAVLLCAEGANFCTGADLKALEPRLDDPAGLEEYLRFGLRTYDRIAASRLPVVAAVQGLCLAGGLELMLSCDIVFAAADARFGDQHARFGLFPGGGGTQRLARLVGQRRALDLMFSARWLEADTALDWGMVNHVVPAGELQQRSLAYCEMLATRNPEGIAGMKRSVLQGAGLPMPQALDLELSVAIQVLRSQGARGGIAEFKARRKPAAG